MSDHLRSNVIGYVALFVALCGTAYAVDKIGPSQIKKNAVRAKHIKDGQVRGPEVDEATLGKVPTAARADTAASADTATSANTATNADTASNADTAARADQATTADTATSAVTAANSNQLGGLGPDQFLHADAIDSEGPTVINDPPGGPPTTAPFLTVGPVSITASCDDNGAGRELRLLGIGPTAAPGSGARIAVSALNNNFDTPVYGGGPQTVALSGAFTTSDVLRSGTLTVFDPAGGSSWVGDVWLSVNMGGDCAFGLAGMSSP
jgi:hypothetical protein